MEQSTRYRTIGTMPAHARVWVYKSTRAFTPQEAETIRGRGHLFTGSWAAHGNALDACVDVLHGHFVVVAVDEQQAAASGCGIDKSVRFIQDLERELGFSLTDRMVVLYVGADDIRSCRVQEVEGLLAAGALTPDTRVFDDLVATVGDLRERFHAPLKSTWLMRFVR